MTENNLASKVEQIYISSGDCVINFKSCNKSDEELRSKIKQFDYIPEFVGDYSKIINGINFLDLETLNTIEKQMKGDHKMKADPVFKKLNKERLATILKCMGFNIIYCLQIAENIFTVLRSLINIKYEELNKDGCFKSSVVVKQNTFYVISKAVIKALTGSKCRIRKYFNLSYLIVNKTIPIIILIGGTSGTGKSTVSSLLASRLGISTVLSTDTIRHIMRNFISKEESAVLFASTYEAWKSLKNDEDLNKLTLQKKVLKGYLKQSELVGQKLCQIIDNILQRQDSVIIEGVHLTVEIVKEIMKKYKYTFPFFVYIEKAEKHKERFAVRSKLMTLEARYNKYVENFENIRIIQTYLKKKADTFLMPKIDNTNVDKSIGMIQETILRSFKNIYSNNIPNYDEANDNLSSHFNNFSKLSKTLLSSKEANILISQKPNKNFLLEKFLSNDEDFNSPLRVDESTPKSLFFPNNKTLNSNNITTMSNNHFSINSSKQMPFEKNNKLVEEIEITNDMNLHRKTSNMKKECLSDDEVISHSKSSKDKMEMREEKNDNKVRQNYQMANSTSKRIHSSFTVKVFSSRTHRPRRKVELDDSNASSSYHKLGSIDSESVNERIKVINETDDELESFDGFHEKDPSNISCGSITEDAEDI